MVMEILEKAEIQNCIHYESEVLPTVEIYDLEKDVAEEKTFFKNEIAFMREGKLRFSFRDHPEKVVCKGEFIFVPVGGVFRYVALEKTQLIIVRLNKGVKLCEGYLVEDLYKRCGEHPEEYHKEIYALAINRPLQLFLDGLHESILGGLNCRYYFDTKVKELFILLKAYYPYDSLRKFFSLILSPDTTFSEHVRANHHNYKTAKELAEAMNMTPKLFSKKFIKIFGESSMKWMKKEKALRVYSELHSSQNPIAQIADKYKFSSQSHLNKFCKREFGKNPGEIRRGG